MLCLPDMSGFASPSAEAIRGLSGARIEMCESSSRLGTALWLVSLWLVSLVRVRKIT